MFNGYLLFAFLLMGLLFVRHIYIFKQDNKINYAPLVLTIGIISSTVQFITHPEVQNIVLILKESLLPTLIGLFLYIVMNILHQSQTYQATKLHAKSIDNLKEQMDELKFYTVELEKKMILNQQIDISGQQELQNKLNQDIKSLEAIQINQGKFLDKFNELKEWHDDVSASIKKFIDKDLPNLDTVLNSHIQVFRVSEQDHFNKIKAMLENAANGRENIDKSMALLHSDMEQMKRLSKNVSLSIKDEVIKQLDNAIKSFESEMMGLRSHTQSVDTSLYENENRLKGIKEQSEIILKQMVIAAKNMESINAQNRKLHDISSSMRELMGDIESVKSDYVKSKAELTFISKEIKNADEEMIIDMRKNIESIGDELRVKIEESLAKLSEHYHIASKDISHSVEMLNKKHKLKGYENS